MESINVVIKEKVFDQNGLASSNNFISNVYIESGELRIRIHSKVTEYSQLRDRHLVAHDLNIYFP